MVIRDPFEKPIARKNERFGLALPFDRLGSHVADFVILAPLMALAMAPFRRTMMETRLLGDLWATDVAMIKSGAAALLVGVLWETIFVALWGTTPGRMIFGLRVVDVWTRHRPRPMHAFLRALAWWLSVAAVGAPFLAVFSNVRRRPLHDRLSDTEVCSVRERRLAVAPLPAELAFGALFASVAAAFAVVVVGVQFSVLTEHHEISMTKDKAPLCEMVTAAMNEWEGGKVTRLSAALALSAAGYLEPSCLEIEADHALWSDRERLLGYLAKGLLRIGQDEEEAESYFDKVCGLESDSDACKLVSFYRSAHSPDRALASIEEGLETEQSLDVLARGIAKASSAKGISRKSAKTMSPDWVRLLLLRELFVRDGDVEVALALTAEPSSHPLVGAKLLEYRARALWRTGHKKEARVVVQAAADALPQASRQAVTTWLCSRELYEDHCSEDSRRICKMMERSVSDVEADGSTDPLFLIASFRHRECAVDAQRGKSMISLLADYSKRADGESGQQLFDAIRMLYEGESEKGISTLKEIAARPDAALDFFVTEANIRLLEEMDRRAASDVEASGLIVEIQNRWFESRTASRYDDWGRILFKTLVHRQSWSQAARVGAVLVGMVEGDQDLTARVAVAAWKAGKKNLAGELLESIDGARLPASLETSELEHIVKSLKGLKR